MAVEPANSRVRRIVRLILPRAHGSWSLALEPLTLGLLAAPSAAGGALAGWNDIEAIALTLVMLARSIPTVLFVRTYLRRNKGQTGTSMPAIIAAVVGFLAAAWLVVACLAPGLRWCLPSSWLRELCGCSGVSAGSPPRPSAWPRWFWAQRWFYRLQRYGNAFKPRKNQVAKVGIP
jgi:hypothetical protein